MQYSSLEPFGEQSADLRMGILASNICTRLEYLASLVASFGGARMHTKTYSPGDFMPNYEGVKQETTKEDWRASIDRMKLVLDNSNMSKTICTG